MFHVYTKPINSQANFFFGFSKKRKKALLESPWLKSVYINFKRFVSSDLDWSQLYVNFDHLESFEVNSSKQLAGWHWKNPTNPNRSLIDTSSEVINLETGVSASRFFFEMDGKIKKKDSIFFPESIQTKEELLALFSTFKVTHVSKNHFLGMAFLDGTEIILAGFFDRSLDQFSTISPIFRLIELKGEDRIIALRKTEYKKDPDLELFIDPTTLRGKIKIIAQEQLLGLRKSIRFISDCGTEFFLEISKEFLPPLDCPLTTGVLIHFKINEVDEEIRGLLETVYKQMKEENLICEFSKLSL